MKNQDFDVKNVVCKVIVIRCQQVHVNLCKESARGKISPKSKQCHFNE